MHAIRRCIVFGLDRCRPNLHRSNPLVLPVSITIFFVVAIHVYKIVINVSSKPFDKDGHLLFASMLVEELLPRQF